MNRRHLTDEQLHAFLLDELAPDERREVAAHLDVCPACRQVADTLQAALAAYRDQAATDADEAGLARLLAARRPATPARPRWLATAVAATAAAIIFMGGFWTGRSDVLRPGSGSAGAARELVPAPASVRQLRDHRPPSVTFAVADSDLLGGPALRDTTWN